MTVPRSALKKREKVPESPLGLPGAANRRMIAQKRPTTERDAR